MAAKREGVEAEAKTIGFRFLEADRWDDVSPRNIDGGLRGSMAFRSPELSMPLPLVVDEVRGSAAADLFRSCWRALRRHEKRFTQR